ncbi:endo-1,3-beta glucanase [Vermiconidia calcicola]|uniref:Endo-1,3-beta glucanase n=1 Tax=Vermiconidia calcicola TaxID=1690605 RepID=A0ACC3N788_9PEZI|nr:endo-1,3-beta glucanase [Vermiconidia calcicola]
MAHKEEHWGCRTAAACITPTHWTNIVSRLKCFSRGHETTLQTSGNPTDQPFPTVSFQSSVSLSLIDTATLSSVGPTATANVTSISAENIFQPIATDAPPPQILSRSDHPVPRLGIQQQQQRLQTNKFYANLFLGDQTNGVWTHPYSVTWPKGGGQTNSWGLAVLHVERTQLATGFKTSSDAGEWNFFASPIGIEPIVLSAVELADGTTLTTDNLEAFSVNANLVAPGGTMPTITFPLVQGMGFVTGKYNSATPLIESGVGIRNVTYAGAIVNGATFKYRVHLTSGFTWLVYVTPLNEGYDQNSFTLLNPMAIQGPSGFGGYIQIAKVPADNLDAEAVYDGSAGVYPVAATITGSVDGTTGSYTLSWTKDGTTNQPLLMFALPHHTESLVDGSAGLTNVQLVTTTKGIATAVQADSWTLQEAELPIDMSFAPWTPSSGSIETLNLDVIAAINDAGTAELSQNISKQTNVGSAYYDGKALAKFAAIAYVLHEIVHNTTLALTGLQRLEEAFALHINNQQTFPLVYDTAWGGAASISTYLTGNSGEDFGNTYYNDHHFHYGYFVYAAAVIGYLNPAWLTQGTNKDWVNMLARDYANPVSDSHYPFSRSFDWYSGHSWAKGLYPSSDGKDQESSSEDTLASYALKMWGKVINDKNMEARGNLMLAVQRRSLQKYFLYTDDNTVEPAEFIGNKVSGIMFENKIDHTTYFGNKIEYIQGIHMLPLLPMSTLIRTSEFVQQEWDAYSFGTYVSTVQGGWRGVLMANLAIIDPITSYNFFSNASGDFNYGFLDGGASQTWYLAWTAALRGSSYSAKAKREESIQAEQLVDCLGSTPVSEGVSVRRHGTTDEK